MSENKTKSKNHAHAYLVWSTLDPSLEDKFYRDIKGQVTSLHQASDIWNRLKTWLPSSTQQYEAAGPKGLQMSVSNKLSNVARAVDQTVRL